MCLQGGGGLLRDAAAGAQLWGQGLTADQGDGGAILRLDEMLETGQGVVDKYAGYGWLYRLGLRTIYRGKWLAGLARLNSDHLCSVVRMNRTLFWLILRAGPSFLRLVSRPFRDSESARAQSPGPLPGPGRSVRYANTASEAGAGRRRGGADFVSSARRGARGDSCDLTSDPAHALPVRELSVWVLARDASVEWNRQHHTAGFCRLRSA